jgi:hypothetical protein
MKQRVKHWWQAIPRMVRVPIVTLIGFALIIAAGLTGPLPGPGGIPLFLLGIAVLASEFVWAEKLRDFALQKLRQTAEHVKKYPVQSGAAIALVLLLFIYIAYVFYKYIT